eukprot:scaffold358809_cov17-Prasinocladus_malaysianus.AAC.1
MRVVSAGCRIYAPTLVLSALQATAVSSVDIIMLCNLYIYTIIGKASNAAASLHHLGLILCDAGKHGVLLP